MRGGTERSRSGKGGRTVARVDVLRMARAASEAPKTAVADDPIPALAGPWRKLRHRAGEMVSWARGWVVEGCRGVKGSRYLAGLGMCAMRRGNSEDGPAHGEGQSKLGWGCSARWAGRASCGWAGAQRYTLKNRSCSLLILPHTQLIHANHC